MPDTKHVSLIFDTQLDGMSVLTKPFQHHLNVPDVFSGELTIPAISAYQLQNRLGAMVRLAFVILLATSVSNMSGEIITVQIGDALRTTQGLNSGGLYLNWNVVETTTYVKMSNISAGDAIVQYIVGGYR